MTSSGFSRDFPRVLIVAEHASAAFGGEAALPLHYYRGLRQRGVPVWLLVHDRTRPELTDLFPSDPQIIYVSDSIWQRWLSRFGALLSDRLAYITTGFLMRLMTQIQQRRVMKKLVAEQGITVIHQPIPVSPKEPSLIYGMNAPVIIGPMNGGIDYPPAFQQAKHRLVVLLTNAARRSATLLNWLMPGKRQADLLLVANQRTRQMLPLGVGDRVVELVENGVDLSIWQPAPVKPPAPVLRLLFVGRLVDWKAVDLLLLAVARAAEQMPVQLTIVGEGAERDRLEQLARSLALLPAEPETSGDRPTGGVRFVGWKSPADCAAEMQQADALVLPSLRECGGAVVLEAMAMRLPVIATAWGGPVDYLDDTCGILVKPSSREALIEDLAAAMIKLAESPELREAMGKAGRDRVLRQFDWQAKIDRMLELYQQVGSEVAPVEPKVLVAAGN